MSYNSSRRKKEIKMVESVLETNHGFAGSLQKAIRRRRDRALPVRLRPVEGTKSKYTVYFNNKPVGTTTVRSRRAKIDRSRLTIGWNEYWNEVLTLKFPTG